LRRLHEKEKGRMKGINNFIAQIIQAECARLTKKCKADVASEKVLYQKMLGTTMFDKKTNTPVVVTDTEAQVSVIYT